MMNYLRFSVRQWRNTVLVISLLSYGWTGTRLSVARTLPKAFAQPQSVIWGPDPTFGMGGLLEVPSAPCCSAMVAAQIFTRPDGKAIIVEGSTTVDKGGNFDYTFIGYLLDGNGNIEHAAHLGEDSPVPQHGLSTGVLGVQSSNRLVYVDQTILKRLNADFSNDSSINTMGLSRIISDTSSFILIGVLSNDGILIGKRNQSNVLTLYRLNEDGSFDDNFAMTPIPNVDSVSAVRGFDPAGRLVVHNGDHCETQIYSLTGQYLATLGPSNGFIIPDQCAQFPSQSFVSSSPQRGFVWAQNVYGYTNSIQIHRASADQGSDPTFGLSGVVTLTLAQGFTPTLGGEIYAQDDGKVVFVASVYANCTDIGPSSDSCDMYLLVARWNRDGSPDLNLGPQGYLLLFPWAKFFGFGIKAQPTNGDQILIVGTKSVYQIQAIRLAPIAINDRVFMPLALQTFVRYSR